MTVSYTYPEMLSGFLWRHVSNVPGFPPHVGNVPPQESDTLTGCVYQEKLLMLRITESADDESGVLLKLEGTLRGPWVEELARVYAELSRQGSRQVRLDLCAVTFMDEAGARLLHELMRGGTAVTVSGFVAELLRREDR